MRIKPPPQYKPIVAWHRERKKLKLIFQQKGIIHCEIKLIGCWGNNALGFAHKHKRIWYFKKENRKLLGSFEEVLLACNPCHQKIESDYKLTDFYFKKLRFISI